MPVWRHIAPTSTGTVCLNSLKQPIDQLPRWLLPFLSALVALGPFAIDAYLPAFPAMAQSFGAGVVAINFSMSAYLAGLALGQILGGPISDQIGRKPIGTLGLVLFALGSLMICFSHSLEQLLLFRVLQALGGGLSTVVVMPILRDSSPPEKVASRTALVFLIMLIAPLIAPFIGAALLPVGWRWIFAFLAIYAAILLLLLIFRMPETRPDAEGKIRAKMIWSQYVKVIGHRLEGKRLSIRYSLSVSFASSVLLVFITNAPFMLQSWFHISEFWFPVFFGGNVICIALVQSFSARYLRGRTLPQIARYYRFGQRAQLLCLAALCACALWTSLPLPLFVVLMALTLSCVGINGPSGSGLYLGAFRKLSGSASAVMTTGSFLLGAILGAVSAILNSGDLIAALGTMLVASLIANALLLSIPRDLEQRVQAGLQDRSIEAL